MTTILIDGIKAVSLQNGINNEERLSGTLLVSANLAGQIVGALTQALQELDKKLREQQQQAVPTAGNA